MSAVIFAWVLIGVPSAPGAHVDSSKRRFSTSVRNDLRSSCSCKSHWRDRLRSNHLQCLLKVGYVSRTSASTPSPNFDTSKLDTSSPASRNWRIVAVVMLPPHWSCKHANSKQQGRSKCEQGLLFCSRTPSSLESL